MKDGVVINIDSAKSISPSWNAFITAKTSMELSNAWLALLCEQIPGSKAAAILVESQDAQTYVPMAVWPEASPDMGKLAKVIEASLRERRGIVQATSTSVQDQTEVTSLAQLTQIAYPLMLEQRVVAVVAIEACCTSDDVDKALRDIHWGSAWLTSLFAGRELEDAISAKLRTSSVLEVLAIALRHGKLQQTLFETINELRQQLACTRSAIGLVNHANVKLIALSEAATFEKNTSLAKAYVRVMEEAYDYGKILQYDKSSNVHDFPEHQKLTEISGADIVISCPLYEGGRIVGVMTLERADKQFSTLDVAWLEAFTAMFAPIVSQRKKADRNAFLKLVDEGNSVLKKLFGPRYLVWKVVASLSLILILILLLVHIDYRVTAKTVIEGEIQRAVSAPFEGFIGASYARAGDTVKQGQLLASLDDRDLIVEQSRWSSERDQYENRLRESMATHDLVAVQVLSAQLNQAEAELDLINKKIDHSKLVAPFEGLVVSGDVSQQIGAPVEVGKKLFEIAPLHSYRVILQIDEREIRHIRVGQQGKLVITGIADAPIPLEIKKVTPVATAQDGKNFFRVEASLSDASTRLRPGMEGVGKIVTDSHSLWWILMHSFTDWLRLTLWTWVP